jgi:hypothetical protein
MVAQHQKRQVVIERLYLDMEMLRFGTNRVDTTYVHFLLRTPEILLSGRATARFPPAPFARGAIVEFAAEFVPAIPSPSRTPSQFTVQLRLDFVRKCLLQFSRFGRFLWPEENANSTAG